MPGAAILLSLLAFLSPSLTLAPLNAVEPEAPTTVRPFDEVRIPHRPGPIRPIDGDVWSARPPEPAPVVDDAPPATPTVEDLEYAAAIEAARATGGAYGITFAAVRNGEVLWSGAAGRYRDGATALGGGDALVIGSVTKTFVSALVLQLAEEGLLSLDGRARDYLPAQRIVPAEVTVRQLMDHTSGLADVFNDTTRVGIETEPQRAWETDEVLATVRAPWYRPGEGYAYANTNYYLLGLIAERVTGSTLAEQLDRRLFHPLGLGTARVVTASDGPDSPLEPAWATIFWASGAMVSSATDLARWGDALYGGDVLSEGSRAAMLELNDEDYGLGVQRIEVPGAVGMGHTGMLKTYTSLLLHLPKQDVTLALLVNRTQVDLGAMLAARPPNGPSLLELAGVTLPKPSPTPTAAPSVP